MTHCPGRRPAAREAGFTLIELIISVAIMLVGVGVALAILFAGVNLQRNAEVKADADDASRAAINEIVTAVQSAGSGAAQGLYVYSGSMKRIGALFGMDGSSGNGGSPASAPPYPSDDLWVVVPESHALVDSCVDVGAPVNSGAATTITATGTGVLSVTCNSSFAAHDTLLATNMNTGALLSDIAPSGATQIAYTESGSGLSDSPERGGFQIGDMVYRVHVYHYYVRKDATGRWGLYRAEGSLSGSVAGGYPTNQPYPQQGRPFADKDLGVLVQNDVEDLQISYGFDTVGDGNPANYTWANGLAPDYPAASGVTPSNLGPATLRSMRISVVVKGARAQLTNEGLLVKTNDTAPILPGGGYGPPDGYPRTVYTRAVDLPNFAPGSL